MNDSVRSGPVVGDSAEIDDLGNLQRRFAQLRGRNVYLGSPARQNIDEHLAFDAYRKLRTTMISRMNEYGVQSTLVTGPTGGIGKTTTAVNLAISLARLEHRKVLLVDFDLRRSTMLKLLDQEREYGVEAIANPDFSLTALKPVTLQVPGLMILPCVHHCNNSSEKLLSYRMLECIKRWNSQKDWMVIYDMPPVMGCDDVEAMLPYMESVLMVVEEGETRRHELREALSVVSELPLLGVVLNKSESVDFKRYHYSSLQNEE